MSIDQIDEMIEWLLHEWQHSLVMQDGRHDRIQSAREILQTLRYSAEVEDPALETNLYNLMCRMGDVFNREVRHVG